MSVSADDLDPLDELGEEFLDRLRGGTRPAVSEFVARDPSRAEEIREFLSALLLVEGLKPQVDETIDATLSRPGTMDEGLDRVGDFRILRELGRGGMGIVYEAEQESLGRHVALKVLAPGVARTALQVRRFVREARSAARLHHSNIVPVFGVGEHDGLHYYAMQYIPGLGLDKVLDEVRRLKGETPRSPGGDMSRPGLGNASATLIEETTSGGPMGGAPPADVPVTRPSTLAVEIASEASYARGVARIGLQVAEALEYAHRQGTLHRDVKPSNILLDFHGIAWITDFGLAKAAEDEDLTRTGDLVGTIRYMAPERFRGLGDARSDVYGLGLVLYELLSMRPAFAALDRQGLMYQVHRVEPARLRTVNRAVPRDLETIVHKAIEKDAANRYSTASELAEDLRRFLEDRPIVARRVGSTERLTRWARRNPGLSTLGTALAGMLALVVVLIAAANLRLRHEHAETRFQLQRAERAERDALSRLLDSYIAQARAGRRSRSVGRRDEGLRAIAQAARLDTGAARRLELRNEAIACSILPDLRPRVPWLAHAEDGYLGLDFDPNSGRIARGTPDGGVLIQGRHPGDLPTTLIGDGLRTVFLRFSPDGRYLATKCDGNGRSTLVVWDVRRAVKVLEVPDGLHAVAADFHPNSRTFAAGRRDGSIVLYDLASGGEPHRLEPGVVPRAIRFDPSGRMIAAVSPNSSESVQVRVVADGSIVASWSLPSPVHALDWHPDGRRLAVGSEDGRIRLLAPDDPARTPPAFGDHDGQVVEAAFHPGGSLLASYSWDGTLRLWDVRLGQELVRVPQPISCPLRFSRDGRLLGVGDDGGGSWLWEVSDGGESRSLIGPEGDGARTWSVDFLGGGNVLASAGASGVRLESIHGDGAAAFVELPGTLDAAVAPDGSALISSGATGLLRWPIRRDALDVLRVGPPVPLGPLAGLPTGRIRFSDDGRTLATVIDGERGRVLVFDLRSGSPPVELAGHANLERLALSPDGRWLATGTWKGTHVKVWDVRAGMLARELPVKGSAEVVFSPDGRRLLTASGTEYVLWEAGRWTERLRIARSMAGGLPGVAAFAPNGDQLALAWTRSTVKLFNPATGQELATLETPDPRNISGLGFSPDGQQLVVTSNASRIQVWDLAALRRGLAPLGLDWPSPAQTETGEPPQSNPLAIAVDQSPWLAPLARGEAFARSARWDEAAAAFDEAIAAGAPHVEPWVRRILFLRANGDDTKYRAACRELLQRFDPSLAATRTVNDLAWSCAIGAKAMDDYAPLIRLSRVAAESWPEPNRLNTLGALLYRSGKFDEAIGQFERSVAAHGAGGTQYDALFLAMAHHRLGHEQEARNWLDRGTIPAPVALLKPDAVGDTSWVPQVELRFLRREAEQTLGLDAPEIPAR